jgi:hypothetical protein
VTIRPILFLFAFSAGGLAQSPVIQTRILTLSLDSKIENVFFETSGGVQPFEAERTNLGAALKYVGPRQFTLRASREEFSMPPPVPVPLATVLLPEKAGMVLLVSAKAPEEKLKLAAYDISPDGFRAGDYRLFNFSNESLSVIIGPHKFALQPGTDRVVSEASWQSQSSDIPIRIARMDNGKPFLVYASVWGHQAAKRNYVFLFNGSHPTRPVGIRRFADYPEL